MIRLPHGRSGRLNKPFLPRFSTRMEMIISTIFLSFDMGRPVLFHSPFPSGLASISGRSSKSASSVSSLKEQREHTQQPADCETQPTCCPGLTARNEAAQAQPPALPASHTNEIPQLPWTVGRRACQQKRNAENAKKSGAPQDNLAFRPGLRLCQSEAKEGDE